MARPLIPRSTQSTYHCRVVSCCFILLVSLAFLQIQIFYGALNDEKEVESYAEAAVDFGRAQEDQARQLEPGKRINRELASEQRHIWLLADANIAARQGESRQFGRPQTPVERDLITRDLGPPPERQVRLRSR